MADVDDTYILALSSGLADLEFPSLGGLARYLIDERNRRQPDSELHALQCYVARDKLPFGASLRVRIRDGSHGGRGDLLGFVFMPRGGSSRAGACAGLMAAINLLQPQDKAA